MSSPTIILGSGIIGLSTAYYLSLTHPTPSSIHVVDPSTTLFSCASGFAGGFLALDWFSPPVSALGKLSFEEHARLAGEFGGAERWGYRTSTALSYATGPRGEATRGEDWLRQGTSRAGAAAGGEAVGDGEQERPGWLARVEGDGVEVISEKGSTAQVYVVFLKLVLFCIYHANKVISRDPLLLCQFLLQSCLERGVQLHHPARAVSIGKDEQGELSSIRILDTETKLESDIPCTKILIAAGAWSPQVFSTLFPDSKQKLPLHSLAGHSLVVRSSVWEKEKGADSHAVFTTEASGYCPEIFSRANGEIYFAGLNSSTTPLPNLPGESEVEEDAIATLQQTARRYLAKEHGDVLDIVKTGLCFRPITARGTPILGRIPDEELGGIKPKGAGQGGVWVTGGHGPWGISMSLGTGKVMAEMIQGEPTSANVSALGL